MEFWLVAGSTALPLPISRVISGEQGGYGPHLELLPRVPLTRTSTCGVSEGRAVETWVMVWVLRSPSGQWRLERQQALSFAFRLTVLEGFREYL
jgi:hypothetical protein